MNLKDILININFQIIVNFNEIKLKQYRKNKFNFFQNIVITFLQKIFNVINLVKYFDDLSLAKLIIVIFFNNLLMFFNNLLMFFN